MTSLNPTSTVVPPLSQTHLDRGYGTSAPSRTHLAPASNATDFASSGVAGQPDSSSAFAQSATQQSYGKFSEDWEASQRGSSIVDGPAMQRSNSVLSQGEALTLPARGGTLKKKASLRRGSSLKRSSSRRSSRAGSVRSLVVLPQGDIDEAHSAFYSPVPTSGNPTEVLANRFSAWRKVLKDLVTYFREIQASYDHRAKNLLKISNVISNTISPPIFLQSGGLNDAVEVLRNYHKIAVAEANKSKDIENDVILALVGLRSDLNQKIKEIKNLSGDFKNSVDKEMENTRKAVNELQECLGQTEIDPSSTTGKKDPYLLKLAVDRQVERQIDEENYLHQAYLNLEASGRELETIVVGEIQKSYNAYAGILKREADAAYAAVDDLRTGPIAMPKDHEWDHFVQNDEHFVDPNIPVREPQTIQYPGRDDELAQEVRAGLLERKSKYLKSYTAGWYVLSPTHLHEFKSADKAQAPVMSLYLPEQKLGSHSNENSASNKFMLKGRQTGNLHRGHSWIFRAESFDTMNAWYEDIKALTEKTPQERSAFVRQHARSLSGTSQRASSISSDGLDEEDEEPFSAINSNVVSPGPKQDVLPRRPQPGGRFPSDFSQQRSLQAPLSPSSGSSGFGDVGAAAALPGSGIGDKYVHQEDPTSPTHAEIVNKQAMEDGVNPYTNQPIVHHPHENDVGGDIAAAGLGVAAGAGTYGHFDAGKAASAEAAEYRQQQEDQAALESSAIAAQDTYEQQSEQQAALEAIDIAAADAPPTPIPSVSPFIPGGRSQGDISSSTALSSDVSHELTKSNQPQPIDGDPTRPPLATGPESVQSISHLHVPGEYPRHNTKSEAKEISGSVSA